MTMMTHPRQFPGAIDLLLQKRERLNRRRSECLARGDDLGANDVQAVAEDMDRLLTRLRRQAAEQSSDS